MGNKEITLPVTDEAAFSEHWDVVIQPRSRIGGIDFYALWRYRDLVWMFFKRDFITLYKQTILGPLWYLIQPSLTAFTYFIVFGKIAGLSTNGVPPLLFYMSGIVLWTYFANCLTNNSEVFSKNASLFSKVYFPRLVVPLSVAMSGAVAFVIQFSLLVLLVGLFVARGEILWPGTSALLIPLLMVNVGVLGVGVGLIVSALTVRFRDLAFATGFVTQLWMYATPVVYTFQQIPQKYYWFFFMNPMTAPVETFRHMLFGSPAVPASIWIANIGVTLILLFLGVVLFSRAESSAMDTV
ncbi:ABC transporter permease [Castellaniella sp. MT123]|uniref:ABC transporter permease n=1 Tax=Castellaniella sp. MT123 TaxID=3140381 RepID=UPI0031F47926